MNRSILTILLFGLLKHGVLAQTSVQISSGYRLIKGAVIKESLNELGYTPTVWVALLENINDQIRLGGTLFYNQDKITQTWPKRGTYSQNRKQLGIGIMGEWDLLLKKHYILAVSYSAGLSLERWHISSPNDFLTENVYPRDYQQRFFGVLSLQNSFKMSDKIRLFVNIGLGENNIGLGLKVKL